MHACNPFYKECTVGEKIQDGGQSGIDDKYTYVSFSPEKVSRSSMTVNMLLQKAAAYVCSRHWGCETDPISHHNKCEM